MGDVKPIIIYIISVQTHNYRENVTEIFKIMNELNLLKVNSVIKN